MFIEQLCTNKESHKKQHVKGYISPKKKYYKIHTLLSKDDLALFVKTVGILWDQRYYVSLGIWVRSKILRVFVSSAAMSQWQH